MESKHTPGPWKVRFFREDDPESGFFVEAPKTDPKAGYNIEILSEDSGFYPIEQRLADAKLIAASPVMLSILKEEIIYLKRWLETLDRNPALAVMRSQVRERMEFIDMVIKSAGNEK